MSCLINYRKDIDGLRALAVISVVIFHLKNSLLSGGFVGVDIFFVISGFLITKIIIREVEVNRFSFTNFYIRRIRRIFPALFLVLFVSLIFAALTLAKEDMIWFAKTLRYAAIQISNFLFQREVGYFDPAFEGMPLLHTWSLAVEEQFYLVWPVTLLLLFKFRKNHNLPFYGLIAISAISLIFSEYMVGHNQKIAFFSLPSRLWELGIGGILAFHKIKQPKKSLNETLGIIGLTLIITSFFLVNKDNFPGINALLPCLGTALIIFSGHRTETMVSRFLANKIFIFFGLISYSLYLWHWPIIAFYREYTGEVNLSNIAMLSIAAISVITSYLSYRYVEIPFRRKRHLDEESSYSLSLGARNKNNKEKPISVKLYDPIIASIICISLFAGIAIDIKNKGGWEWRLSKTANNDPNINKIDIMPCRTRHDLSKMQSYMKNVRKCVTGNNKENFEVVLFGDSHADNYHKSVLEWAKKRKLSVLAISSGVCPPISGDLIRREPPTCSYYRNEILEILKKYKNIKYIFLSARWSVYDGSMYDGNPKSGFMIDAENTTKSKENTKKVFSKYASSTIEAISKSSDDRKIVILGQVPFFNQNPIKCLKRKNLTTPLQKLFPNHSQKECLKASRLISDNKSGHSYGVFSDIAAKNKNIEFFDPSSYFCDDTTCYAKGDGVVIYKDTDHLNIYGSTFMKKKFSKEFNF